MNPKERDPEEESFKINDQRRFNPNGTEKAGEEAENAASVKNQEVPPSPKSEQSASEPESLSFAGLILSLAGAVQTALGLSPNPLTPQTQKNLKLAKQNIDLLGLLAEKTKGNLTKEEDELLQVVLTDLRLRYVEEKGKS